MASGIEILMGTLLKQLPPEVLQNLANIGQISVEVRAQLDRIEAGQKELATLLREIIVTAYSRDNAENTQNGLGSGRSGVGGESR